MVPEVKNGAELRNVAQFLDARNSSIGIVPLIERPTAVFNVHAIATADTRIKSLVFGDYDFRRYMGISTQEKHPETLLPRYLISMAASAAGVPAIDTVYLHRSDESGLEQKQKERYRWASMENSRPVRIRFLQSTKCSVRQMMRYELVKKIINEFESAGDGSGLITVDGMTVDKPIVDEQRTLLTHAREWGSTSMR